ncbi:MAG TPA: phenylacetate--CoA ligase [Syntrophobacteraceae bacterium]|nr:phenylacetate--CoA ligase [Syntrophobacteraceae bacterium]
MATAQIPVKAREQIRQLQLERLQVSLNRAYLHVEFYRQRMDELGILPEEVGTFETLRRFPFTTSRDLSEHYPYGLFAMPLRNIVRLKMTTGNAGQPVVVGFTRHDTAMWQELMVRLYRSLGVNDRDIVQLAFNFSLFPGAYTLMQAAESLGATLAPSATISATLQLKIMQDFRSTVLATTPAFALHIVAAMERQGIRPGDLHLRVVLVGPEPIMEPAREHLETCLQIPVRVLYGVAEMVEPGLAGECMAKDGLHLAEDQFLAEIVHPVGGEPVGPGQEGELVLTTLGTEAYPLIRYRTGDITVLHEAPCVCGQTTARIRPILRRTDNRVSVRGIPFYPEQISAILRSIDSAVADFRLIIYLRHGIGERMEVLVARTKDREFPSDTRASYLEQIRSHLRRTLGLGARVQLVEDDQLPMEGLIDKTVFRNLSSHYDLP